GLFSRLALPNRFGDMPIPAPDRRICGQWRLQPAWLFHNISGLIRWWEAPSTQPKNRVIQSEYYGILYLNYRDQGRCRQQTIGHGRNCSPGRKGPESKRAVCAMSLTQRMTGRYVAAAAAVPQS